MSYKGLWIALGAVLVISFKVLAGVGVTIPSSAPPMPQQVVTADGRTLFDHETIQRGQGVWQSLGGQEVGSIWGHGAYLAPDWTADWLHREAVFMLDWWAHATGATHFAALPPEQQAGRQARLKAAMRTNTYDPATGQILVDPVRAEAFDGLAAY
jgi:nitric oxide reductase subunit B